MNGIPTVYTRDVAFEIVDMFDDMLTSHGIRVPSPEDNERGDDNDAALYGSVFSEMEARVEDLVLTLARYVQANPNLSIILYTYSGRAGVWNR